MPVIRIDLDRLLYEEMHEEIGAQLHEALIDALDMRRDDRFQIFHPHDEGEVHFDPTFGNVDRKSLMFIHVTMVHSYAVGMKRNLYKAIVQRMGTLGIRSEDIVIAVQENGSEDWYAGNAAKL
jgi:hypothetical protein